MAVKFITSWKAVKLTITSFPFNLIHKEYFGFPKLSNLDDSLERVSKPGRSVFSSSGPSRVGITTDNGGILAVEIHTHRTQSGELKKRKREEAKKKKISSNGLVQAE